MYGLPDNIDLSFLLDKEVIQVCFGSSEIQLHFHEEAHIHINGRLVHRKGKQVFTWEQGQSPSKARSLIDILGATIVDWKAKPDGTLHLKFSKQQTLSIFDHFPNYESYHILCGDKEIIV